MDTNQPKISVIVPVYKAEAYLHRCVDSLLAQTFQDFEILLVDDGSPDRSGEICDEYARKDKRVRVCHKENGGVSSARQCGMYNARGEYTIHADPDDWVEADMLEELYKKAKEEDADMVCCNYREEYSNRSVEYRYNYLEETWLQIVNSVPEVLNSSLWNKLIRRDLYLKNNIRFFEGINMQEDLGVTLRLRTLSKKTIIVPVALYHYNKLNEKSVTSVIKSLYIEKQKIQCAVLLEQWFRNNAPNKKNWEMLINNIKFCSKINFLLSKDIRNVGYWINTFFETNRNVLNYQYLSLFTRIPMWLVLHHMVKIGIWGIDIKNCCSSILKYIR